MTRLGLAYAPHRFRKDGYLGESLSRKILACLKQKVMAILNSDNVGARPVVRDRLNTLLRGWLGF